MINGIDGKVKVGEFRGKTVSMMEVIKHARFARCKLQSKVFIYVSSF
jgi:hypothetical protein